MQNVESELKEGSRMELTDQLTDLRVEDGLKEQKVVVECPKENLTLKQGTVQTRSKLKWVFPK